MLKYKDGRRQGADQTECGGSGLGNTMMPDRYYSYLFHMSYMQVAFAFTGCGIAWRRFPPSLCTTATRVPGDPPKYYAAMSRSGLAARARIAYEGRANEMTAAFALVVHPSLSTSISP